VLEKGAIFETGAKLILTDTAELALEPDTFKGVITGFGGSDFLDIANVRFVGQGSNMTAVSWNQTGADSGTLTVAHGSQVADLHMVGQYTTANFAIMSDGVHGTTVTFVP